MTILATFAMAGCGGEPTGHTDLAEDFGQTADAIATKSSFSVMLVFAGLADPGTTTTTPGGVTHTRDQVLLFDMSGDFTGVQETYFNANQGADGSGPGYGTFRWHLDGGGFDGRYAGHLPVFSGHFKGAGDGAYDGEKVNGDFQELAPGVFELTGTHLDPHGD